MFRFLMFSLSGPSELLFLLCFIVYWNWVVVSVMLYPCILCVAWLTVCVNCLVKQSAICLGVVVILLLNVMEVFSVGGGALLEMRVWSSKECVCCACDPSVHLSVHFIGSVHVCVKRK